MSLTSGPNAGGEETILGDGIQPAFIDKVYWVFC